MGQLWQAIVGSTTYQVSGGVLSWRISAHGTGMPPVRRLTVRSPQQHGHTDLGFRYDARQMRLAYFFDVGSPDSADTRRDDLYDVWKALESTPIKLRVTRDDGNVRQIDCHVTGVLDMPDDLNDRIGPSQRFVVTLEAADPMWYDPTQASTSFTSADTLDWWLALGTISSAQVKEYVENPTQAQSIDDGVLIADGQPWTVFFRTTVTDLTPSSAKMAFQVTNNGGAGYSYGYLSIGENKLWAYGYGNVSTSFFATGEHDYFIVCDGSNIVGWRDSVSQGTGEYAYGISGANASSTWRGQLGGGANWTPAIPNGAIYNIALSSDQRNSLTTAVDGGYDISKTITYSGSFVEYPVITITGPITDAVLTNVSTGETLDFTGITIAGGTSYTIDCRFGYKTVKNSAGTNKIADLTSDSDLATFHLAPAPEVSGGANAITLTGTSTDSNTQVTVAYYNRYVGM